VADSLDASTLPKSDQLAVERTLLANERTFLAYFRSSVVFLSSGLAAMSLEVFENVRYIGVLLIVLAPPLFGLGLYRYVLVRRRTLKYLRN